MTAAQEWKPPELRSREELVAMIEYVKREGYSSTRGYDVGLIAALEWAAGITTRPPVSEEPLGRPVTGTDAQREQYNAYEAMSPLAEEKFRNVTKEKGLSYVTGVENTLAWAAGSDTGIGVPADWPWPQ